MSKALMEIFGRGLKKMKIIYIIFSVLLALSFLAGCISKEIRLGMEDNGRQVELNKGQILIISLEGNPSTGYMWEAAELDKNILRQIGETEFQPGSDLLGAKGMQTLRFEAANTGQTPLKLVYHRPWEKDVEPLKNFSIQVAVR